MERDGYVHMVAQTGELHSYVCRVLVDYALAGSQSRQDR